MKFTLRYFAFCYFAASSLAFDLFNLIGNANFSSLSPSFNISEDTVEFNLLGLPLVETLTRSLLPQVMTGAFNQSVGDYKFKVDFNETCPLAAFATMGVSLNETGSLNPHATLYLKWKESWLQSLDANSLLDFTSCQAIRFHMMSSNGSWVPLTGSIPNNFMTLLSRRHGVEYAAGNRSAAASLLDVTRHEFSLRLKNSLFNFLSIISHEDVNNRVDKLLEFIFSEEMTSILYFLSNSELRDELLRTSTLDLPPVALDFVRDYFLNGNGTNNPFNETSQLFADRIQSLIQLCRLARDFVRPAVKALLFFVQNQVSELSIGGSIQAINMDIVGNGIKNVSGLPPSLMPAFVDFFQGYMKAGNPSGFVIKSDMIKAVLQLNSSSSEIETICHVLNNADPVLIKFLQMMGDEIPNAELRLCAGRLKKAVIPMSDHELQEALDRAFPSGEFDRIFSDFERKSFSAASICQGHFATLRKGNRPVFVKIKRARVDLKMKEGSEYLIRVATRHGLESLFSEMVRSFELELKLDEELNQGQYAAATWGSNPDVIRAVNYLSVHGDSYALIMERVNGITLQDFFQSSETASFQNVRKVSHLLKRLAREWFEWALFKSPYQSFHGDLHAGNIMITGLNESNPRLVLIDYGNAHMIDESVTKAFLTVGLGVRLRRPDIILIGLGADPTANTSSIPDWRNLHQTLEAFFKGVSAEFKPETAASEFDSVVDLIAQHASETLRNSLPPKAVEFFRGKRLLEGILMQAEALDSSIPLMRVYSDVCLDYAQLIVKILYREPWFTPVSIAASLFGDIANYMTRNLFPWK